MYDPQRMLISLHLESLLPRFASTDTAGAARTAAREALRGIAESDAIASAIESRSPETLVAMVESWKTGKSPLPAHDRELLKGAMTTFRKSLKVKRLDAESSIGGGPMSGGRKSAIAGIVPPSRFSDEIWKELARQGRLVALRNGTYTLPPE